MFIEINPRIDESQIKLNFNCEHSRNRFFNRMVMNWGKITDSENNNNE